MVKSYVRIYGPPLLKALKALEGVAVEMNRTTDVTFSHKCIPYPRMLGEQRDWESYLQSLEKTYVDCYEPAKLISQAHETLGENDFFFEWKGKPSMRQIETLIEKIDDALKGLGCYYTLKTE